MTIDIGKTEANKSLPFIEWLTELPDLLTPLVRWKRVSFLASCCERLYGNYLQFNEDTGWGEPLVLCQGICRLWNNVGAVDTDNLQNIRNAIEAVTPDTEDFSSAYTSAALDAAAGLLESLAYCVDDELSHCVQVACLCRDSIYMFVQQRGDLDHSNVDELRIYADPLMLSELRAQQSDIRSIQLLPDDGYRLVAAGKQNCDPNGGSLRNRQEIR
jgi:uncharacterized protein YjaG (DUF416 family)